jgi:hypothetical protein
VRGVDDDQARGGSHQPLERLDIVAIPGRGPDLPQRDVAAQRARDAVQLLVGRERRDHVVTRVQQDVEQEVVGLDGARRHQHTVGVAAGVGGRDRRTERGGAPRLAIA